MEELQKLHRQERKHLQSEIAQKKKSATKKTRKSVNDECTELEQRLLERQSIALAAVSSDSGLDESHARDSDLVNPVENGKDQALQGIDSQMQSLSVSSSVLDDKAVGKKPNRQRARLARRAAEQQVAADEAAKEAAGQPNLREQEREEMRIEFTSRGLKEKEIRSDGHCLYAAVADQLLDRNFELGSPAKLNGIDAIHETQEVGYRVTREVAANFITENADDFVPFLEEPLGEYVHKIRDTGEWGGHLELMALAKAYNVDINVLQSNGKIEKIECGSSIPTQSLWLSYYHHNFGLGEHYNSLYQTS
ncbi:MAG: hypothetical protein Q9190_007522 [Brigantiaea leucoxantha]